MELGSNSPVIVWRDADVGWAVESCVSGAFWAAGQNCIGVQRIYVHREIYGRFRDGFVARTARYKIGDKLRDETDMGPMINEGEAKRLERWVREAVGAGARVLIGGGRKGALLEPTVLENVPTTTTIHKEEVFGPTVNLYPVDDADEALAEANSLDCWPHAQASLRRGDDQRLDRLPARLDAVRRDQELRPRPGGGQVRAPGNDRAEGDLLLPSAPLTSAPPVLGS
jgi:glyceraldehyde-3-phosphate dehydrogenase (NADP+)